MTATRYQIHIVTGAAGTGKSTFAKQLAHDESAILLDSDTVSEPIVRAGLQAAGMDPADRDSSQYKGVFRDPVYQSLFDVAAENLLHTNVVIVGPFTRELSDPTWPWQLEKRFGVVPKIWYLHCDNDLRKKRIQDRGNPRDQAKLVDWEQHVASAPPAEPTFEVTRVDTRHAVTQAEIRGRIVAQILNQFQQTMPIYAQMMDVAQTINQAAGEDESRRLGKIMHAAIRCASPAELQTVREIFELIGCQPVNYYDLRENVSVQSTAFRPVDESEIQQNGFRLFCSMLSIDCIAAEHQPFVQSIIDRRNVFPQPLLDLIEVGQQAGWNHQQVDQFVELCVELFVRPETALVSQDECKRMRTINKVAAQVLITNSLAFNHLTPSVASVPLAHQRMVEQGIETIPVWQGPVGIDVILRQTSCLAPPVVLKFPEVDGTFVEAEYQETFVEFEERLQALTPVGRQEFERRFAIGKQNLTLPESDPSYADHYYQTMTKALDGFPTDQKALWQQGLAYFTFEIADSAITSDEVAGLDFEALIECGIVGLVPQQYEDFFGPAATNIFNSNIGLSGVSNVGLATKESQEQFEQQLGSKVVDMYDYYAAIQNKSQQAVMARLASFG